MQTTTKKETIWFLISFREISLLQSAFNGFMILASVLESLSHCIAVKQPISNCCWRQWELWGSQEDGGRTDGPRLGAANSQPYNEQLSCQAMSQFFNCWAVILISSILTSYTTVLPDIYYMPPGQAALVPAEIKLSWGKASVNAVFPAHSWTHNTNS